MKIVSWNVNGLAACKRKGFLRVLARSGADIFCCQEIKTRCPISTPGYLQFWDPAKRPGYSGTLTLARKEPLSVRYGMGIREFDVEGRLITLEYDGFYALNVYVPNSQSGLARLEYRTAWDAALREFLLTLDKPVILCGDFNVAREHIDIYPENLRNEPEPPGFQSLEREGMERLLALGLILGGAPRAQAAEADTQGTALTGPAEENSIPPLLPLEPSTPEPAAPASAEQYLAALLSLIHI